MPVYEFTCTECDDVSELTCTMQEYTNAKEFRCICGGLLKRVFSFSIKPTMPEHYNNSAGQYISNEKQLKDVFKVQSEQATERTGIEHNFVPVHPDDREKLGVTSEGLRETYDRRRKLGMKTNEAMRISD